MRSQDLERLGDPGIPAAEASPSPRPSSPPVRAPPRCARRDGVEEPCLLVTRQPHQAPSRQTIATRPVRACTERPRTASLPAARRCRRSMQDIATDSATPDPIDQKDTHHGAPLALNSDLPDTGNSDARTLDVLEEPAIPATWERDCGSPPSVPTLGDGPDRSHGRPIRHNARDQALCSIRRDTVAQDLSVEGLGIDAEERRGLGAMAADLTRGWRRCAGAPRPRGFRLAAGAAGRRPRISAGRSSGSISSPLDENDRALDGVLQLAHVARPGVAPPGAARAAGQRRLRPWRRSARGSARPAGRCPRGARAAAAASTVIVLSR